MLILSEELHQKIMAHGEASYPYEGCGLLLGTVEDRQNIVRDIRPLENVWPDEKEKRVRFRIDPQAWQAVELEAMMRDLDVIGIFHSHPDHPPIASPRDLAWASWPGYSYLITKIEQGVAQHSRSWQLAEDRERFEEEKINNGQ
ncbi:MAG: M67 family metallopeptidase [Ardenticatenaceae bacterium]|nr:M67 family metallopeptidase [Ardenticatenaceae bacterium]